MEEIYCLYKHTSPSKKVYIGITKRDPKKRWESGNGYKCNKYFYSAIQKYGWENFSHEILLQGLTKSEAEKEEIRLIKEYKATDPLFGYNLRNGGSLAGFNEETIKKMRISHTGYKMPESQRKKISDSIKLREPTFGTLGHFHTEETKKKMSMAAKGKKKPWMENGKNPLARAVVNLETGEVFSTIKNASLKHSCSRDGISKCCRNLQETCGGCRWAYIGGEK